MQLLGLVIIMIPIILVVIWQKDREEKTKQERIKARHKSFLPMLESSILYHTRLAMAIFMNVRANAQACALARPADVTNHLAPLGEGVILDGNEDLLFCYRFERSVVCPGGGKIEYSTLPAQEMAKILNRALPNYCRKYGVWPLYIVGQEEADLGFVYFYIKPFNDWTTVENYLRNEGYQI